MKNLLSITLSVCILFSTTNLFAQISFYKNYEYDENDSQVFDITALSTGGYAMVGIANNESNVQEAALTKLNCAGEVEWAKKYGNSSTINNVFSSVIEADNGDIVMVNNVGTFQSYDIVIARIRPTGETVWKQRYGGNRDDAGRSIIQIIDGHFVIAGGTGSWGTDSNSSSSSFTDVYLMKVDQNTGDVIWGKTYGNPNNIDAAYAVTEDAIGNLYATGRCIVDGAFYTFILKTDDEGEVDFFKGFGAGNHRTYGYDIGITSTGDIVLTGSSTINKEYFNSYSDVFLIKTDAEGTPIFTNVYYPWLGEDRSESGSSLVFQDDGGYGIGVPTLSFTNWSSGFVPNKNAVYSINEDGSMNGAYLFNQGGSHYTRLRKDLDGGYILSNFSNFFNSGNEFIPLIVKTDANYEVACNRIDVSSELEIAFEDWDIQAISYTADSGFEATNFSPESEFSYSLVDHQCETIPEALVDFTYAENTTAPEGTFDFTNTSPSPGTYLWDFADGNTSSEENPSHNFSEIGMYNVCLTLYANCDTVQTCQTVNVDKVTDVKELENSPCSIFPNPVEDLLFVQSPDNLFGLQLVEIYNVEGKLLYSKNPSGKLHQSQLSIPVGQLTDGMYFLKLHFAADIYSVRFVK